MSVTPDNRESSPERPLSELCMNLENKFSSMQELSKAEAMRVYARIRPMLVSEMEAGYKECIGLIDEQIVRAVVPASSAKYKMSSHLSQDIIEDFTYTAAYGPETGQFVFFQETMMDTMQNFIVGQNSLVFSYGTTGSGKTFTLQGNPENPGIIPLSLHLFFASIEDQLLNKIIVKPDKFADAIALNDNEIKKELDIKEQLLSACDQEEWSFKNSASKSFAMMLCDTFSDKFECGGRQTTLCPEEMVQAQAAASMKEISKKSVEDQSGYCSVWISFVEIYNESIYDLLQPNINQRTKLNLGEDKNGDVYIKGLREVCVFNSYEALKLLNFGQRNLRIASTKLNYQSSRSHCIFTIKVIRIPVLQSMVYAKVNRLSFCDLAGSERASKSQTTGLRLKEAGCINTSLLVLGRCLEQLRLKPSLRDKKLIPFRESKLTRVFSGFFTGRGKAVMITNASPSELTFDETLHVLRFSAVAKELIINDSYIATASSTLQSITNMWTKAPINCKDTSHLSDRSISFEDSMEEVVQEKDELIEKLLDLAESLKNNLEREKQEKAELEIKIRQDVCQEYSEYSDELLDTQKQAFDEERESIKEIYQKRISAMEKMYENIIKEYKLQMEESDESGDEHSDGNSEIMKSAKKVFEICGNEVKCTSLERAVSVPESLNTDVVGLLSRTNGELQKTVDYSLSLETELESLKKKFEDTQLQLENTLKDNEDMKEAINALKAECFGYKTEKECLLRDKLAIEQDLKALTEDLATVTQERETISEKLTESESKVVSYSDELTKLLERINELMGVQEECIMKYEKSLDEANEKADDSNDKLLCAVRELEEEREKRFNLEGLITTMEGNISELKAIEQNNIQAQKTVEILSKQIDDLTKENGELKEELEKAKRSSASYCKSIADLKEEINKLNSNHLENIEKLNDSIEQYKIENEDAKKVLISVNKALDNAFTVTEEQKQKLAALEDESTSLKDEVVLLQKEKKDLESKLKSMIEELESENMAYMVELDVVKQKLNDALSTMDKQKEGDSNQNAPGAPESNAEENKTDSVFRQELDTLNKKLLEAQLKISEKNGELEKMILSSNSDKNRLSELELLIKEIEDKSNSEVQKAESEKLAYKEELDAVKQKLNDALSTIENEKESNPNQNVPEVPELSAKQKETDSNCKQEFVDKMLVESSVVISEDNDDLELLIKDIEDKANSRVLNAESEKMAYKEELDAMKEKLNNALSIINEKEGKENSTDIVFHLLQVLENCEIKASDKTQKMLSELENLTRKIKTDSDNHENECRILHDLILILEKCESLASKRVKEFHTSSIKHVEQIMDLEKCVKTKEKVIEDLRNDYKALQKQIKDLQISSKKELQAEKQLHMSVINDMKKKQLLSEDIISDLKKTESVSRQAIESLKKKQSVTQDIIDDLTRKQSVTEEENESLRSQLVKLKAELDSLVVQRKHALGKAEDKRNVKVLKENIATVTSEEKSLNKERIERGSESNVNKVLKENIAIETYEENSPNKGKIEKRSRSSTNKKDENLVEKQVQDKKISKKTRHQGEKRRNKEVTKKSDVIVEDKKHKTKIYEETDENSGSESIRKEKRVGRKQLRCMENVVQDMNSVNIQNKNKTSEKSKTLKRKEKDETDEKTPEKKIFKKLKLHDNENISKPQNLRIALLKASVAVNDIPAPSPRMTRGRRRQALAKQNGAQSKGSPRTVRS